MTEPSEADRFAELARTGDRDLRNRLVEDHLDLAEYHVRRYRNRGVPEDDLRQVARLGIVHAAERFDPDVGVAFSTFASRTIDGDLKRWFRDRTWAVRPPRRHQELHLALRRAEEDLTHELGRPPRVPELADALGISTDDVLEGLEARAAYRAASVDPSPGPEGGEAPPTPGLASHEAGFGHVDDRQLVRDLLATLPDRERTVLELRFFEGLSQDEIAERVGVSQSYLSRLLRRTLRQLHEQLTTDGPPSG